MREFNKRGIITPDVEQYYLKQPASLCLSDDNFKLRLTFAEHTGLRNQKNFSLLKCTRKDIEHAMVETLGYDPENKKIDAQRNSNSATLIIDMVNDKRIKGYQIAA